MYFVEELHVGNTSGQEIQTMSLSLPKRIIQTIDVQKTLMGQLVSKCYSNDLKVNFPRIFNATFDSLHIHKTLLMTENQMS